MLTLERPKSAPALTFSLLPTEPLYERLIDHTIRQLKQLAKLRRIPSYSRMTKPQLVEVLTMRLMAVA
ncbi:MAG: hypothetical protein KME11_12520 [Timaviella obliquedivisa GSE-PSE-MK23-08B]|jgi:hypothetical protein|nr:hypothetical protein [Timaviella obliquedivisa GSE-PSE-MK23-08B]